MLQKAKAAIRRYRGGSSVMCVCMGGGGGGIGMGPFLLGFVPLVSQNA